MTTEATPPTPPAPAAPPADPAPAAAPPGPSPSPISGLGQAAVTAPIPNEERVKTLPDEPPPPVDAPPPGPSKLERAMAAAEAAKKQRQRRQREAAEAERIRLEREQYAASFEQERRLREEAEARARSYEEADPYELLQRRGVDAKTLAERAVEESTPEGQIRALKRQIEERDQRFDRWQRTQQEREQAAQRQQAEANFVRAAKDAEAYPTLSRLASARPQTLLTEGYAVANEVHRRTGRYPTDEQIMSYLEYEYSKALRDGRPSKIEGTTQALTTPPAQAGQPAAAHAAPPTARASERAVLPKALSEMTKDEQIAHFARQLREGGARG